MAKSKQQAPPDHKERQRIVQELDTTMLVEAAAGTGKTTSLVSRMIELLASGRCAIDKMAAITFTRKAAAELRSRFQLALEQAARQASGERARVLMAASDHVEQCCIGTIHSFCARLLRERPVEADVEIGFQEVDEAQDWRLREQAWAQFVAQLYAGGDAILEQLNSLGLEVGQLAEPFYSFANYPDVEEWPVSARPMPDLAPARSALSDYVRHMRKLAPDLPEDAGNDSLIPKYRLMPRLVSQRELDEAADLMEILEAFGNIKIIQKNWPDGKDQAKKEEARWTDFRTNVADPLLKMWREVRHAAIVRALIAARVVYDHVRRDAGVLNYQDLLLKAAALLRDKPHISDYFRSRFSHLLVDEFQDTDPIQAQVMMFLTADDPKQQDWRKCRPVPGSLFVVGDPKQSIYRFRRADIVTYNEVRKIILAAGGSIVTLQANFRTIAPVVTWINTASATLFPTAATDQSPADVPLAPARQDGSAGELSGVCTLRIPEELGKNETAIPYDADLVARTIRKALDDGLAVPRTERDVANGVQPRVNPGDFMIITRTKKRLSLYADRLAELGIPHEITGSSVLNEVCELDLLRRCLVAAITPDDPVALVAALRSELFGVSDQALYGFKMAGGWFSFRSKLPEQLSPSDAAAFKDAFDRLNRYAGWLVRLPVISAIEKIAADLGLAVLAAVQADRVIRAGSFCKAIELLRSAQIGAWTVADVVDYLGQLVQSEESHDGLPARPHDGPVVRVMNLHKVKGLEAPVVFLADPAGEWDHGVGLHIDRQGTMIRGYMAIYGQARGRGKPPLLASPAGWDGMAAKEQAFQDAEKQRLLYVAATRAGAQLVISQRGTGNEWNPWSFFEPLMADCPDLQAPGEQKSPPAKPESISDKQVSATVATINNRWGIVADPTYAMASAKAISVKQGPHSATAGEHGTEWGSVIHLLLQAAVTDPKADMQSLAASALADEGLDPALAGQATQLVQRVTTSSLWKRAQAGSCRLAEVPFQRLLPANDGRPPSILRGVIDLAFLETGGWVIVDYKTDDDPDQPADGLVKHYGPQVRLYSDAWHAITGQPVHETGLFLVRSGRFVTC